jgi:hypothetical protein
MLCDRSNVRLVDDRALTGHDEVTQLREHACLVSAGELVLCPISRYVLSHRSATSKLTGRAHSLEALQLEKLRMSILGKVSY